MRGLIKHAWLESGTVYGYRKITRELREAGERCSRHRVRRLLKAEGIRAEIGYGTKPRHRGGPRGMVENIVNRDFSPAAPNTVWVTDPDDHRPCATGTGIGGVEAKACRWLDHPL